MGYVARLIHGSREFSLNDSTYSLWSDFIPPAPARNVQIAAGTSRNKRGGKRIGAQPLDRSWYFGIRILGSSIGYTTSAANRLQSFLDLVEDESESLYFEYSPTDAVTYRPLWGQGFYRYEIKDGIASIWEMYPVGDLSSKAMVCPLTLIIGPHAEGLTQRLGSATGGIFEDILGMADGHSRGVNIPLATTNKFTNPIFGHATYNNDWTTGASLVASKNTDKEFIVFGSASVKLIRVASVDWGFTQSINVGNTNTHCLSFYVKKSDKSAVTSSDCQVYYNAVAQTTAFLSMGDGWYRAYATFAGVNGAVTAGIILNAVGMVLYADGFHLEEAFYITPAGHGDMLGWVWTGTAHASTSTRTAGRIRIPVGPTTFDIGQGTIRMIWEAPYANTAPSGSKYFFSNSATGLRCGYNGADDKIYLQDNTNDAISAAQTFAIGDKIVYHFTWKQASMKAYKNGAEIATVAAYTPPTAGSYLYIGSDDAGAGQLEGTILGFDIYGQAMTATEALADYNNISPLVTDNQRISAIPWLWTKNGDNTVDNCYDSDQENFVVINGIPGNTEAITIFYLNAYESGNVLHKHIIGKTVLNEYADPANKLYYECAGQATAATDSASNVTRTSTTTTEATIATGTMTTSFIVKMAGKTFYPIVRIRDATAGTLYIRTRVGFANKSYDSDYQVCATTTDTSGRIYVLKPLAFPSYEDMMLDSGKIDRSSTWIYLRAYRATGTVNTDVDYFWICCDSLLVADFSSYTTDVGEFDGLLIKGKKVFNIFDSIFPYRLREPALVSGEKIELTPGKYNILMSAGDDPSYYAPVVQQMVYNSVDIIPYWDLL